MSTVSSSPRHTASMYGLLGAGAAALGVSVYAELGQAGTAAAVIAAIGVCAVGLAGIGAVLIERKHVRERMASMEEELRKARRAIVQQQTTARKLIERDLELSHANDQLREMDEMKSEFITVATHQLRTPLSAIRWTLHMLLRGDVGTLTEEQKQFIAQAYESNNRLIGLLHSILLANRIESGKIEHSDQHALPATVIEDLLAEMRVLADKQHISIQFVPPDEPCPPLAIDPTLLRTVLQNILENAVQYSKQNSTVTISLSHQDERATITIADHGIGIPRDAHHHIFTRFYRAPNAISMVTDGTGLGLYIAKRIVEHEGGSITFTSEEHVGTTFFITLPLAPLA